MWLTEYDFDDSCLGPSGTKTIVKMFLKLLRSLHPRKKYRLAFREVGDWCEREEEHSAEEFRGLVNERDELKEKLEAAERCIEDIDGYYRDCDYSQVETLGKISETISAYRKKEIK